MTWYISDAQQTASRIEAVVRSLGCATAIFGSLAHGAQYGNDVDILVFSFVDDALSIDWPQVHRAVCSALGGTPYWSASSDYSPVLGGPTRSVHKFTGVFGDVHVIYIR